MPSYIIALCLAIPLAAMAQSRPLETRDEARQRHNAERYRTYEERGRQAPLGGYSERLGDPAPRGTESPGYISPGRQGDRDRDSFDSRPSWDRPRSGDGSSDPLRPRR